MTKRHLCTLLLLTWTLLAPAIGQDNADQTNDPAGSQMDGPEQSAPQEQTLSQETDTSTGPDYKDVLSLNEQGLNPDVQLYNLAVVDAQQGRMELALARWRQSLYLNPTFKEARKALEWGAEEISVPEAGTLFETLRSWLWLYQPGWVYPLGVLLTLFVGMWLLLGWVERSRQNRAQDLDRPPPPWSMVVLLTLALMMSTVWALRTWDRKFVDRATYLGQSGLKVSPSLEAPEVKPLKAGVEVILERTHEGWSLVHVPGGAAGWVSQKDLYKTTSKPSAEDLAKH